MSGWLIHVPVKRSGGSGRPIAYLYAAWVPEPMDALDAVHQHMSDDTVRPETVAVLSDFADKRSGDIYRFPVLFIDDMEKIDPRLVPVLKSLVTSERFRRRRLGSSVSTTIPQ